MLVTTLPNIILRPIAAPDVYRLHAIRNNPEVQRYLLQKSQETLLETKALIREMNENHQKGLASNWAIACKNNNHLLGYIGFWWTGDEEAHGEIGYLLEQKYWGQGITSAALQTLLPFLKTQHQVQHLKALVHTQNIASVKILQRQGFKLWDTKAAPIHIYRCFL